MTDKELAKWEQLVFASALLTLGCGIANLVTIIIFCTLMIKNATI